MHSVPTSTRNIILRIIIFIVGFGAVGCLILTLISKFYFVSLAEQRVKKALAVYPGSELVYEEVLKDNGNKVIIYWTEDEYSEVAKYNFVTGYRIYHPLNSEDNYKFDEYLLSELSDEDLEAETWLWNELCCYGAEPRKLTLLYISIFALDKDLPALDSFLKNLGFTESKILALVPQHGTIIMIRYRTGVF